METTLTLKQAAGRFLEQKRIAVTGLSRTKKDAASLIYTRLRAKSYQVFAVHPAADKLEGDVCYKRFDEIPGGAEALVIAGSPGHTKQIVEDAVQAGIQYIWIHHSIGSSLDAAAIEYARKHGAFVIPGACPMMFIKQVDFGHVCLRGVLGLLRRIPGSVTAGS